MGWCKNNGTCQKKPELFSCECKSGFTGFDCGVNINDCDDDSCMNGGICIDGVNSFTCDCPHTFTGTYCEEEIGARKLQPHYQHCHQRFGKKICSCSPGYWGEDCERSVVSDILDVMMVTISILLTMFCVSLLVSRCFFEYLTPAQQYYFNKLDFIAKRQKNIQQDELLETIVA